MHLTVKMWTVNLTEKLWAGQFVSVLLGPVFRHTGPMFVRLAIRLLCALLVRGLAHAQAPTPLNLEQAMDRALAHNRELARSALGVRSTALGIQSAEAGFRLRLQPAGRAATDQDGSTLQAGLTASRTFLPGTELSVGGQQTEREDEAGGTDRRTVLRVNLEQPLFRDFGILVNREPITRAEQQLRTARRSWEQDRADLVVQVVQTFENLIKLRQQIASDQASFQRMDKLYRLTVARERQGRASRVDTLRVELNRGQAQSRLEDNQQRQATTRREFAELLGDPPETEYTLDPPPLLDLELPSADVAVATALSNRLDYAQALQDYQDARRGVRIAEKALQPALALVTRYERIEDDQAGSGLAEDQWSVGLAGDTELTRAAERARFGQAALSREAAAESVYIRELAIARELQQLLSAYQRARSELGIAERNYKLAENRARLARRLFERGRGDNFSVTDAEEALQDADNRRLSARAEASISGYQLLRGMGMLVEAPADLKPDPAMIPQ